MLQSTFNASTLPLLEKLAVFGERRQEVLAGNIANIDTPEYKMRDLPVEKFQDALRRAVMRRARPASSGFASSTRAPDEEELFHEDLFRAVESPQQNITFQDANNRSIEHQMMEMTKNSMMQQFAVELMGTQYRMLETVISERV